MNARHAGPPANEPERTGFPEVSVIMTVLNESSHIRAVVERVLSQDYVGDVEIVVALGPSKDGTDSIAAELAARDNRIRTVANPRGLTPAGLNAALAASKYEIVARVDGHAVIPRDYLRIAVETLEATGADNVGGIMWAEGETPFEEAVARAMTTKLGVGNARFHTGGEPGPRRQRLSRRVPAIGARAGRWLRRGLLAGAGLGDELSHPAFRWPGLVSASDARLL